MGEKIIKDFVKNFMNYNPKIKSNSQLRDDFKLMVAYYSSKKSGNSVKIAGVDFNLGDIMLSAKLIFNEIESRRKSGTMSHDWNIDSMRPAAKEMFDKLNIEDIPETKQQLTDHITEDIVVLPEVVFLAEKNELRLNLEDGSLARAIKAKLYKLLPDDVARELNIALSDARSHNPTPLFDLVLKRREVTDKAQKKTNMMSAITPASSQKVFYNIPDLVEVCFA